MLQHSSHALSFGGRVLAEFDMELQVLRHTSVPCQAQSAELQLLHAGLRVPRVKHFSQYSLYLVHITVCVCWAGVQVRAQKTKG